MSTSNPTNDELTAAVTVGAAGREAAEGAPTAAEARPATRRAIKAKAAEVKMKLSEEDIDALSDALVDKIEQRGGFDEAPEKVTAPVTPAGAPAAGAGAPEPVPVKQSWAERRFRS
jgi:hypothetical protein